MRRDDRHSALAEIQSLFSGGTLGGLTDRQLLARFAARGDKGCEAAFALIVKRHGPMVMRVCRSVLGDSHDAEDAFQATFLVLAEKAATLQARDTLGPWLYQVACRVASCARSAAFRRRKHELRAAAGKAVSTGEKMPEDVASIVHEEVNALPARYRAAVVLCCLQGRSHAEAARQLGCPVGTVESRLARGRERLRIRLARRGLAPLGVLLVSTSSEAALPGALAGSTARLASLFVTGRIGRTGAVSAGTALLWKVVMGDLRMARVKLSLLAAVAGTALAALALTVAPSGVAGPAAPAAEETPPAAEQGQRPAELIPLRLDLGPLRVGATADPGAYLFLQTKEESAELSVKVTPPRFVKVRGLQIRERTRGDRNRLVELRLGIDTSRPGQLSGQVRLDYGDQRIDLPITATVLPSEPDLTKVLVVTPGFGRASRDTEYYRPWFDLVKSAKLDVSYLDPSIEGLAADDSDRDGHGMLNVPDRLKRYDVILLADGGPIWIQSPDARILQSYVRGGGRLVVVASNSLTGTVLPANAILKPFGLEYQEDEVWHPSIRERGGQVLLVRSHPEDQDPLIAGVDSVTFSRATPVRVRDGGGGRILFRNPKDNSQGFAAVSRDFGEVVALGPALLFDWLGEKENGADNVAFLRNLLTYRRAR